MRTIHPFFRLLALLVFTALACNFPGANTGQVTPASEGPQATITALAQTIEAGLTQTAITAGNPTLPPTSTAAAPTAPPTNTPQPTKPPATPVPPTAVPCDKAQFVSDVSIPDGTILNLNQSFTKTWRLKNVGSCTWSTSYALVFDSGNALSGPASQNLPGSVSPGQTIDLSVNLKTPGSAGTYRGNWKLRNASGATFGLGDGANAAFWVEVKVQEGTPSGTSVKYSFVEKYCDADWRSGAGDLDCPGSDGDADGFVIKLDNPKLETGLEAGAMAIETHPEWVDDGYIQGEYPAIAIENGFRFRARVGCLHKEGGSACNVKFLLKYSADGGAWTDLGPADGWLETYDNSVRTLDIDLSSLAGKNVKFLFQVSANGSSGQDWALWINPRIIK